MCKECGCGRPEPAGAHGHAHEAGAGHGHRHPHDQEQRSRPGERVVDVRQSVLSFNDRLAEQNRGFFRGKGLFVVNLLSAPGSGKTALLERTLTDLAGKLRCAVIVGDLQTDRDAVRLREKGAPAVQVTTGEVCHLDAHMVQHALDELPLDGVDVLFVENVGNLVCPASFDLGEGARVVLIAVTEGEDKPLKYPVIFHRADLVIVNKIDLAGAVGFDAAQARANIRQVAPRARIIELSARTGAGANDWYAWLSAQRPA